MVNTSALYISRSAYQNNINYIKKLIGEDTKLSAVIKGNAYGHGIEVIVPLAEECGVDHFSVFSAQEARRALKATTKNSTILVMGWIDNAELEWAIMNDIEFFVFEFDRLKTAIYEAKQCGKKAKIHIEIETGMNRTGFSEKNIGKLIQILQNNKEHYEFSGLCTHYAGAESISNYTRIKSQIKTFNKLRKWLKRNGLCAKTNHTACSAAAISYPETRMDMVRSGILQYGFWPSPETFIHHISKQEEKEDPLTRVLAWRSRVMDTKDVKTGEFIGYGTNYIARDNMKIATVPVGYAMGYSRSLSHQGRVLINGQRQDIIGIVNMSLLIVKITEIPDTQKGDEVVLIGKQDESEITVSSFSEFSDQLNYEMLTRLPADIPRIIEF